MGFHNNTSSGGGGAPTGNAGGDLGGTYPNPTVVSVADVATGTLGIGNGGTGAATQQAAIDALAGTQSSGKYLRSDGTHTTLTTLQAGDVPTLNQNTSGTAASLSANLVVTKGGTGTGTAFTLGSVVFAGASGTYSQDNSNFFYDSTHHYLGLRTSPTNATLHQIGQHKIVDSATVGLIDWGFNSSPDLGILQIWTTANYPLNIFMSNAGSGNTFSTGIAIFRQNGTTGSETALGSTDSIGFINFGGTTAANTLNACARIFVSPDGAWSSSSSPGKIQFQTTAAGGVSTLSNRITIRADGSVGIGTTTPTHPLEVNGVIVETSSSGFLDLSAISAGNNNLIITATSNTPSTTYSAHVASTDPAGYLQIQVGGASRYIPFFT